MFRPALLALTLTAALPGCSALSALSGAATPLDSFDLTAPLNGPKARGRATSRQMVVELPTASGALNNDRILVRPNPLQAQYLPDAQWAVELPMMVQTLMVRSLEDSNAFRYVGRRPLGAAGDYALLTEITDFQAEAGPEGKTATIQLRITARIVREDDAAVIASRSFTAQRPVASTESLDLVQGFNAAGQEMLSEMTSWVLGAVNIPSRPGS